MSPFGHAFATFHVKAPVFVARQLVKHKFLRWNEISRRYVDDEPEFYEPDNWRGRNEDKKQGSTDEEVNPCDFYGFDSMAAAVNSFDGEQLKLYNDMLAAGVCPEQARMVLPQSMMTEWYWSGSLDAFSDMCLLRCASDTQAETQEVANQISHKMHELFTVSWMALAKGRG
jgi:thymidylate synthase (FAD)